MSDNDYYSGSKRLMPSSIKIGTPIVDTSDVKITSNVPVSHVNNAVKHAANEENLVVETVVISSTDNIEIASDSSDFRKNEKIGGSNLTQQANDAADLVMSFDLADDLSESLIENLIEESTEATETTNNTAIDMPTITIQSVNNEADTANNDTNLNDTQPLRTENMNINSNEQYDNLSHFEPVEEDDNKAVIKIIGIGGGGGNALNHIKLTHDQDNDKVIGRIDYYVFNTDMQDLKKSKIHNKVQIGDKATKGLGAGANQEVGQAAAEESIEKIKEVLTGADMVFLTAGMGGGTGTGATPVVARIAKELGILTVAVVTKPFSHEGKRRNLVAEEGIIKLSEYVDSLIVIPNDKLIEAFPNQKPTLLNAFGAANDVLFNAVSGISEMIGNEDSLMNVDFADVRTVMTGMGRAMIGIGCSEGEPGVALLDEHGNEGDTREIKAIKEAIASPLLENTDFSDAQGILVSMIAGPEFMMDEFTNIMSVVRTKLSESSVVVNGVTIRDDYTNKLRVTIVAAGLKDKSVIDTGAGKQEQNTLETSSGIGSIKMQNELDAEKEREARLRNRVDRASEKDIINNFDSF